MRHFRLDYSGMWTCTIRFKFGQNVTILSLSESFSNVNTNETSGIILPYQHQPYSLMDHRVISTFQHNLKVEQVYTALQNGCYKELIQFNKPILIQYPSYTLISPFVCQHISSNIDDIDGAISDNAAIVLIEHLLMYRK
jgi:hypothetical protein